jgi:hypothetical protein
MAAISCPAQSCVNYFVLVTKTKPHKCNMCLCSLDKDVDNHVYPQYHKTCMIHGLNCKTKNKIDGTIDLNRFLDVMRVT